MKVAHDLPAPSIQLLLDPPITICGFPYLTQTTRQIWGTQDLLCFRPKNRIFILSGAQQGKERDSYATRILWLVNMVVLFFVCSASGHAQSPAPERSGQLMAALENGVAFSFVYDGKPSKEFLASWQKSETVHPLSGGRTLRTITYRDPATHLEVSREITLFPGGHAIEWVLRLRNGGRNDSPMLEKILPLDIDLPIPAGGVVIFHHAHGSSKGASDYEPVDKDLTPGTTVQLAHYIMENGLHKDGYIPFFNLQWSNGGLVGAIGWTGQWMVSAGRSAGGVALKSGQQLTHLRLHAGESIRTPQHLADSVERNRSLDRPERTSSLAAFLLRGAG